MDIFCLDIPTISWGSVFPLGVWGTAPAGCCCWGAWTALHNKVCTAIDTLVQASFSIDLHTQPSSLILKKQNPLHTSRPRHYSWSEYVWWITTYSLLYLIINQGIIYKCASLLSRKKSQQTQLSREWNWRKMLHSCCLIAFFVRKFWKVYVIKITNILIFIL